MPSVQVTRRAFLSLGVAVVLLVSGRGDALDLPDLAARTKPSVVLITLRDSANGKLGTGTGFFVSADGHIVTNFHVIENGASASATLADGREAKILGVLAFDQGRDIAILKAEGLGAPFPALALGDSSSIRPGDEVVVIGSPRGLSGTVSAGIVSAVRERGLVDPDRPAGRLFDDGENATHSWGIQITAAISPGSSGSPIMTRGGEVVAVAVGTRLDGQALNFGVPIEVAKELLARSLQAPQITPLAKVTREAKSLGPQRRSVTTNLAISAAFLAGIGAVYFVVSRVVAAVGARRRKRR